MYNTQWSFWFMQGDGYTLAVSCWWEAIRWWKEALSFVLHPVLILPNHSPRPSSLAIFSAISPALVSNPHDQIPSLSGWQKFDRDASQPGPAIGLGRCETVFSASRWGSDARDCIHMRPRIDTVKHKYTRWPSDWGVADGETICVSS